MGCSIPGAIASWLCLDFHSRFPVVWSGYTFPDLDFSISAAIGFISLFGVSVMSGILILNGYYRVAAHHHGDKIDAMFEAVQEQMRPILMMTLSACIGLLPAAISTGIGSQVQRPLATVIVGGMLIGPIMLLVIVPALQSLFLGERDPAPAGEFWR